jgi:hypothetical protein
MNESICTCARNVTEVACPADKQTMRGNAAIRAGEITNWV